jgi:polygalacturonase
MAATDVHSVSEFGAVGDGSTLNSQAIQKALDTAGEAGGGTVRIPAGVFRCGTIELRSNVLLELAGGAVLKGSEEMADYPAHTAGVNPQGNVDLQPHHFILADGVDNAGIVGPGTIDGSGPAFWDPPSACEFFTRKGSRPSPMIEIRGCRDFALRGVTVYDSPGWTVHVNDSQRVRVQGVNIRNNLLGPNTDGLDITDSRDVIVSDCNIVAGDDAIVLKSLGGVNERITVTNCILQTNCSALKLGASESIGTIRQVSMSNCVVRESSRGISLYNIAGGTFEDVSVSNIVIDCHVAMPLVCPIHLNLSQYPKDEHDRGIGVLRNVRISDVLCRSKSRILLTAQDGGMMENIFLRGIHMEYPTVENRFEQAREAHRAGQFSPFSPDARAARAVVVAENIRNLQVSDVSTHWPSDCEVPMGVLWARNVRGGLFDCPLATPSLDGVEAMDVAGSDLLIRSQ